MADLAIQKTTMPLSDLPPVFVSDFSDTPKYFLKYRIVADDKKTHWSTLYTVQGQTIDELRNGVATAATVTSDNSKIRVSWTLPGLLSNFRTFDVFVSWSTDNSTFDSYTLASKSNVGTTATIEIPSGKKYVKVIIQLESIKHIRNSNITLYESSVGVTTVNSTNGGVIGVDVL